MKFVDSDSICDETGKIGSKRLSLSGDFRVIRYSWKLRKVCAVPATQVYPDGLGLASIVNSKEKKPRRMPAAVFR